MIDTRRTSQVATILLVVLVMGNFCMASNFVRGDANVDGRLDISDPLRTLTNLFIGGAELSCRDAADANDDGAVNISDPVATLEFLFLAGAPLAEPYPDCGTDPTWEGLDCESFDACPQPPPEEFVIEIGQTVSDGEPAPGAGNIETSCAVDIYKLEAAAGTLVYVDELSDNPGLLWRCVDEDDGEVFVANNILSSLDVGPLVLSRGGTYSISVFSAVDAAGAYSFAVLEAPQQQEFEIAIGDVVSEGVPLPGAGASSGPRRWMSTTSRRPRARASTSTSSRAT